MSRKTHSQVVSFHKGISTAYKGINGFYRFNISEITGQFRSGIKTPALLLESHSNQLESQTKMVSNFNAKSISFIVIDFAGKAGEFDKQELVLDQTENIALDIISFLVYQHKLNGSWLFGMFDINSVKIEKVGPIFDNMYGWNVIYTLKNPEPMTFDPEKWDFSSQNGALNP